MLGTALVPALRAAGHAVLTIGRGGGADIVWDPARGQLDATACAGLDGFVHLGGANIGQRWTASHRRAIRDSRVDGTTLLARTAAALSLRPRVVVSASAVGIYGDAGDAVLDESSPVGEDFLAQVSRDWETAAAPASAAGIRVVHLRFGVILSRRGGALARLWPVFRLGLGGRLGNGRQWMSWVSLDDAVAMVRWALERDTVRGPVNAVAPLAVTNAEFTAALARAARRPALFTVPTVALKLMFGEMAQATLLASQRCVPRRLGETGFQFAHPTLDAALRAGTGG